MLGKPKHCIKPFPGGLLRVAFGSNLKLRGPHMGLIHIPEGHIPPGAWLGCRWCVFLDDKLGSGSLIRAKSVDFQILAMGAAPRPEQRPFRCLGGTMCFFPAPGGTGACFGVQFGARAAHMAHPVHRCPAMASTLSVNRNSPISAEVGAVRLGALGHFEQRRPAKATKTTHSGTGPALAAHPTTTANRPQAPLHPAHHRSQTTEVNLSHGTSSRFVAYYVEKLFVVYGVCVPSYEL